MQALCSRRGEGEGERGGEKTIRWKIVFGLQRDPILTAILSPSSSSFASAGSCLSLLFFRFSPFPSVSSPFLSLFHLFLSMSHGHEESNGTMWYINNNFCFNFKHNTLNLKESENRQSLVSRIFWILNVMKDGVLLKIAFFSSSC